MSEPGGSCGSLQGGCWRLTEQPNEDIRDIIRGLSYKKCSVAQMVNLIATRSPTKENGIQFHHEISEMKKTRQFHRGRRLMSSSEEELLENEPNGEEAKFLEQNSAVVEDIAGNEELPKIPLNSEQTLPNVDKNLTFEERLLSITDTDSSDTKTEAKQSINWLCKPRLNHSWKRHDDVSLQVSEVKGKRKRAVISSSSDEEAENAIHNKRPISLKMLVKKAKKHRKNEESSDEMSEDSDSDGSCQSTGGSYRNTASSAALKWRCLKFFNEASRLMLMATPRINGKVADFIINNRPFQDYENLMNRLLRCPRGSLAAEQYLDFLANRSILENILDDCRRHSEKIYSAVESVNTKQMHLKPELLSKQCELHPYQQLGMNWLVMMHKLNLNAILADEMGLGKTIQVIAFLTYLKGEQIKGPHLIVVPSSTLENWLSEFSKWSPTINIMTYYGSIADRRQLRHMANDKNIDVLLTTYNMVGSKVEDRKFFKRFRINYVIYDEGHLLKNCSTDRYKNLMKVRGERKIMLTGTPLQNNLVELISLMYFTMTKLFTKYCDDIGQLLQQFQQKIPSLEAKNGELYEADKIEQAKAILRPYILRRLKSDVLSCLPKKKDVVIKCAMNEEQKEIYMDLVREFRELESNGEKYISSRLMQLRQIANHPLLYRRLYHDDRIIQIAKVLCAKENEYRKERSDHVAEDLAFLSDFAISQLCSKYTSTQKFCLNEEVALESGKFKELDKLLPPIKEKGDKVLIFSQFTSLMDILEVYLKLRYYRYCRLDGATPVLERQEMINQYNSSPDVFVFLLSTKAGGMGINLTAANHVILHDIDFNPYNDKQAEGRCHRMGQKKDVFVVRLISAGTVEEEILALAQKKLELEKEVTGMSITEDNEMEGPIVEQLLKKALSL